MNSVFLKKLAVAAPEILLPKSSVDLSRWAVIACDQFTSEPDYWKSVAETVGESPSTLKMVLPEVFLESLDEKHISVMIELINHNISSYLRDDILEKKEPGVILVDRKTPLHPSRKGIVLSVDLDQYDFTPGTKSRIRATEGTVLSRIPPRVRIRKDAAVEIPHIMLLIDDPDKTVVEAAYSILKDQSDAIVYDTELMMNGGHLRGYYASADSSAFRVIVDGLSNLLDASQDGFLFAVGDGNHSLATAKAHWDSIKAGLSAEEYRVHPARFALVEVVNIHDEGLDFEPIHRMVFGLDYETFATALTAYFGEDNVVISQADSASVDVFSECEGQVFFATIAKLYYRIEILKPVHPLAVGTLQIFLDDFTSQNGAIRVDYIHGADVVEALSEKDGLGFILPPIYKTDFFPTLSSIGIYPRKTFSMGEALEKRYYMEAKSIVIGVE